MLLTERRGDVLNVTLDRPDSYNAINAELRDRLVEVFDGAEADGVRAIALRGNGRGFCAGFDLKESTDHKSGPESMRTMRLSTQRLVRSYLDCPVPIVAAVHGAAAGIGLTLALGADICIAADDAKFTAAFVQRALVPDGASIFLLPRLIGMARTKDFLMRGRSFTGGEAADIGLISEAVGHDRLTNAAEAVASGLATMPTVTLSLTKQLLAQTFDLDLNASLLAERAFQGLAVTSEDATEGRRAFVERREAQFTGH